MGDSCVAWAVYVATGSGTRIYPCCLYWLFGTHFLWRDTLLILNIVGRDLVLPQMNVLDFGDFLWEALPSLSSGMGVGGKLEGVEKRKYREL